MPEVTPKPHEVHPIHYLLHAITGLVTFIACVMVDVAIVEYRHNQPHRVVWQDGSVEEKYVFVKSPGLPPAFQQTMVGISDKVSLSGG